MPDVHSPHPTSHGLRRALADILEGVRLLAGRSLRGGGHPSRDRDAGRRGAAAILIALLLVAIIGFISLGTEVVLVLWTQRHMQSAADDAALAAATAVIAGYPSPYTTEAYAIAASAGFTAGQGAGCDATPTVYAGPPCDGTHSSDHIEVLIREPFTLSLAKVLFADDFVLHGRAVAGLEAAWACAAILDPTGNGALKVNGTANVNLNECTAWVNSIASAAVQVDGGGILSCDHLYVGGTATGVDTSICPKTENAPTVVDPYRNWPMPSIPATCTSIPVSNIVNPGAAATVKLCNPGISLTGSGVTLKLCPGVYIIDGALGANSSFKIRNNNTITLLSPVTTSPAFDPTFATDCPGNTGTGLAFVLTSSGATSKIPTVDMTGSPTLILDGIDQTQATAANLPVEMLFFQDRRLSGASNTSSFGGTVKLTGILYFPNTPVVDNGNSPSITSSCFQIISWTLAIGGNPTLNARGCLFGTKKFGQPALVE